MVLTGVEARWEINVAGHGDAAVVEADCLHRRSLWRLYGRGSCEGGRGQHQGDAQRQGAQDERAAPGVGVDGVAGSQVHVVTSMGNVVECPVKICLSNYSY